MPFDELETISRGNEPPTASVGYDYAQMRGAMANLRCITRAAHVVKCAEEARERAANRAADPRQGAMI